jgi:micrococcal nuclease
MDTILSLLFLITFLSFIAGLVKPTIFNKLFKKEMTRKKIMAYFGSALILIIIILPSDQENTANKNLNKLDNAPKITQDKSDNPSDIEEEDKLNKLNKPSTTPEDEFNKFNNPSGDEKKEEIEPIIQNNEGDNFDKFDKPSIPPENDNSLVYYQVDRVVDGDTVRIFIDGVSQSIRLIGIDTPETVHPSKPVECMGKEASETAKRQLEGKKVALEIDQSQGDKDKYDRLIRYVISEDGTNFNKWMILEGYAYEYTYNLPYKYQTEFKQAQATAQANKKGLWADGVCDNFETEEKTELETNTQTEETNSTNSIQGQYDCSGNIYNCSDFKTHAEAQSAFDYCLNLIGSDIHKLDADNNSVACESLP